VRRGIATAALTTQSMLLQAVIAHGLLTPSQVLEVVDKALPEKYYYMTLEVIICLIIRIYLQGKPFLSSKSAHCFSGEAAWHYRLSLTATCTTTASA
jgi:hypothetical protein